MVMHPDVAFVFAAVGLQPGLVRQMADHPASIHQKAGGYRLRMEFPPRDRGKAAVDALIDVIADKAGAEPFRTVKEEIVAFRLGMAVREIARPVAAVIHDLTEDHIGPGFVFIIEDGIDLAVCGVAEFAFCPGVDPRNVVRHVKLRREGLFIVSALDEHFAVVHERFDGDGIPAADMGRIRPFGKDALAGAGDGEISRPEDDLALQQQRRDLLTLAAEGLFVAGFHSVDPDVHQHMAVFIIIGAQGPHTVFIKFRISKSFHLLILTFL